jgi:hypothetical protein
LLSLCRWGPFAMRKISLSMSCYKLHIIAFHTYQYSWREQQREKQRDKQREKQREYTARNTARKNSAINSATILKLWSTQQTARGSATKAAPKNLAYVWGKNDAGESMRYSCVIRAVFRGLVRGLFLGSSDPLL